MEDSVDELNQEFFQLTAQALALQRGDAPGQLSPSQGRTSTVSQPTSLLAPERSTHSRVSRGGGCRATAPSTRGPGGVIGGRAQRSAGRVCMELSDTSFAKVAAS